MNVILTNIVAHCPACSKPMRKHGRDEYSGKLRWRCESCMSTTIYPFYQERKKPGAQFKHGDPVNCPTCGAPGRYDTMNTIEGKTGTADFREAVWFDTETQTWLCHECWLK